MAATSATKATKQTGGASGDSVSGVPDTSTANVSISRLASSWWVTAYGDSTTVYTVQVSPDDGVHWYTVRVDTLTAGTIESTGDLGNAYAGMQVRVIQDADSAAEFGNVDFYSEVP